MVDINEHHRGSSLAELREEETRSLNQPALGKRKIYASSLTDSTMAASSQSSTSLLRDFPSLCLSDDAEQSESFLTLRTSKDTFLDEARHRDEDLCRRIAEAVNGGDMMAATEMITSYNAKQAGQKEAPGLSCKRKTPSDISTIDSTQSDVNRAPTPTRIRVSIIDEHPCDEEGGPKLGASEMPKLFHAALRIGSLLSDSDSEEEGEQCAGVTSETNNNCPATTLKEGVAYDGAELQGKPSRGNSTDTALARRPNTTNERRSYICEMNEGVAKRRTKWWFCY